MTELTMAVERLQAAGSYLDVFSTATSGGPSQKNLLKREYRKLAGVVHPDRYETEADRTIAQEAFVVLQQLYEEALLALKTGRYGKKPALIVTGGNFVHEVTDLIGQTDACNIYAASSRSVTEFGETIFKIARQPRDNDLLDAEASALRRLKGPGADEAFAPFLPSLVESLTQRDPNGYQRRANIIEMFDGWYSLEDIAMAHPDGISPLDMAWMWRRLLYVLGYVHDQGLVHGAVLPRHVLVQPEQHGVVLSEWCYSVSNTVVKAAVRDYRNWYPEEVLAKQLPSPATDIYMAAKTMIYVLGGDPNKLVFGVQTPKAIRAFLRSCCLPGQAQRPQEAWQLIGEFDELLERLGNPYWPRRFHVFSMPA